MSDRNNLFIKKKNIAFCQIKISSYKKLKVYRILMYSYTFERSILKINFFICILASKINPKDVPRIYYIVYKAIKQF